MEHCSEWAFGERFSRFLLIVRDTSAKRHLYEIRIFRWETDIMSILHPCYVSALWSHIAKRPMKVRWKLTGTHEPQRSWQEAPKPSYWISEEGIHYVRCGGLILALQDVPTVSAQRNYQGCWSPWFMWFRVLSSVFVKRNYNSAVPRKLEIPHVNQEPVWEKHLSLDFSRLKKWFLSRVLFRFLLFT